MVRMLPLLSALLLYAAGQLNSRLGSVGGKVLDEVSGTPVKNVTVRLISVRPPVRVLEEITDGGGTFTFGNVEPGSYHVALVWLDQEPNSSRYGRGSWERRITLGPGERLHGLVFPLPRPGVITGQVTQPDGLPLPNARVTALTYVGFGATRRLRLVSAGGAVATADDQGRYRLHGLPPGRYLVRAAGPRPATVFGRAVQEPVHRSGVGYEPAFYPGVPEARRAFFVTVRSGQEVTGINFELNPFATRALSGVIVSDAETLLSGGLMVTLRRSDGQGEDVFSSTTVADRQGRFFFDGVMPGRYRLSVHGVGPDQQPLAGDLTLDIDKNDVRGLVLPLRNGSPAAGVIRVRPAPPTNLVNTLVVKLGPADFNRLISPLRADVDAAGRFTFQSVPPGDYRMWVEGLPDNWVVQSIRLGGVEVGNRSFQMQAGAFFSIEISSEASSISGLLTDADRRAVSDAYVILTRRATDPSSEDWCVGLATDQHGAFGMTGLPPGRYRVYAFDSFDSSSDHDIRKFLEQFDSQSSTVELEKNENAVVTPRLIEFRY